MKHVKLFEQFINEAVSKAEKAIKDALYDFDDINHKFRFKYFDVIQVKNEIFIDWITQEDYNNDGEALMIEHLKHLAKQYNVKIFLHYTVRDNDSKSNRNRKTKKGYVELQESIINEANDESRYLDKTVVYDNGGKTADRYTVFTPDDAVYGMGDTPNSPQGFNQYVGDHSEVEQGSHLGKKLREIPKTIKQAILGRRLNEANDEESTVKYKGVDHVITRKSGDRIYLRRADDSAILGQMPEFWVKAVDLQESSLNEAKSPAKSHKLYKKLLKYFKDDYWDEIRDMARRAREYHTEYDLDMLYTDWETNPKAPQPLDFRKLKSNKEWNEKGKAYILNMLDKMGEQAVDAWFDDFDHWLK